jgi:hypothetical protein
VFKYFPIKQLITGVPHNHNNQLWKQLNTGVPNNHNNQMGKQLNTGVPTHLIIVIVWYTCV